MAKSHNYLAVERQWTLMRKLPEHPPGITARELVEQLQDKGYTVTKRTVERDLEQLSGQFGIRCNDISKPYGWYWLKGKKDLLEGLEIKEAVTLSLAEHILNQLLPAPMAEELAPTFAHAREKLNAIATHPLARLQSKVRYVSPSLRLEQPHIRGGVLESLKEALINEVQISALYSPPGHKPKELKLHPLALVQRAEVLYLVACAFRYDDIRLYAAHRFEQVDLLEEKISAPADFSIDHLLDERTFEFGDGDMITLKARINERLALYLSETPLEPKQKLTQRGNHYLLTAQVRDSWQLHFWILSQANQIEILSPKPLRERIASSVKETSRLYAGK